MTTSTLSQHLITMDVTDSAMEAVTERLASFGLVMDESDLNSVWSELSNLLSPVAVMEDN
jgi:sulfite reductase beta subunit-like hemoprotein